MSKGFDLPVLFLIYNRADKTRRVFSEIRRAQPRNLYIAADGPRADKAEDGQKVQETRKVISLIDWDCKVKKLLRDHNLGCGRGVAEAISWFFDNVEMGIILEDDCVPLPSFFPFCQEMLEKYKDDLRVWHIGGSPHYSKFLPTANTSYLFSKYPHIWGWATWRNRWSYHDLAMSTWPDIKQRKKHLAMFDTVKDALWNATLWDLTYTQKINSWDYQWLFAVRSQNGLAISSTNRLVENIGFDQEATHTKEIPELQLSKASEIIFPLKHPDLVLPELLYDQDYFRKNIFIRIVNKFGRLYRRLCKKYLYK